MKSYEITEMIVRLAEKIDGVPLISSRGVPHIVATVKKIDYSVCYFGNHKSFRVFYPYMEFDKPQDKQDFKTEYEVVEFFKERRNKCNYLKD